MSNELFTSDGKRKYVTAEERDRFIAAAQVHERGEVRNFLSGAGLYGLPDFRSVGAHAVAYRLFNA